MAIAYVTGSAAAAQGTAGSTTIAVTLGAAVAVDDVIVGMVGWDNTNSPTISAADNLGGGTPNAYTIHSDQINDTTNTESGRTFRCKVTQAGTPTITVTFSASAGARRVIAAAWSGSAASPFDTSKGNGQFGASKPGTGTDAATSTTITTATDGELCVGFHHNSGELDPGTGTITAGTNYTSRLAANAILMVEERILATAGSVAATVTISNDHDSITHIVAIKAAQVATDDILVRLGSMDATTGSGLVTAAFATGAAGTTVGAGLYPWYYQQIVQDEV